jgi:hypothetical protein
MENALVHRMGDVATLAAQMTLLSRGRELLERLPRGIVGHGERNHLGCGRRKAS